MTTSEIPSRAAVGYGIIGTGLMGLEHIRNIAAIGNAAVVALSDPNEASRLAGSELAGSVARDCGVPGQSVASYADHRDLLEDDSVDAVVVASPNHTHIDVVADVLASGRHVLIEKPLCTTVDDCRKLIGQADGLPQVIQVGLEYRWMPPVARLVEEVRDGAVGVPRMVAVREHRFPFLNKVGDWNRFSVNTGGTLVEKCCHFFDLMNHILDERPRQVMASGAQDVNHLDEVYDGQRSDILDNAFVIVDYPSGARASLDLCMFAEATHNQEEISVVGERGKLEALIPEGVLRLGRRGEHGIGGVETEQVSTEHIAVTGHHHGSSYLEHLAFLEAIELDTPPPITLDDGLWSVAMGVAAHRSIDEGRPIELAEILDDGVLG